MAEPTTSESSPDTDRDFDPSADMMVHDFDDERTLDEEEEAMSGDSSGNGEEELNDLQKEGDMPIEELLAFYGYNTAGGSGAAQTTSIPLSSPLTGSEHQDTRSSSEEEILSNQDLTLDKDEIARDLLKDIDNDRETSVTDLLDSVEPSQTERLLRCKGLDNAKGQADSSDESEDLDYEPMRDEDWKKTIQVGSDYQVKVPEGLSKYGDAPAYENEDRLLWDEQNLKDDQVENFLREVHKQSMLIATGINAIPTGAHVADDEQALYLLLQCNHNVDEALRRRKMQTVAPTDPMSLWSEEECQNFESGLRIYGKDFYLVQQNKVRTRSVGELVQFYYLWKKTERHDVFANKTRLEKKKYSLHPGVTDYMDRFLDEDNSLNAVIHHNRVSSPIATSSTADKNARDVPANSEDLATALEMMQKVVDPGTVERALSPDTNSCDVTTGSPTMLSVNPDLRTTQSSENTLHIATVTTSSNVDGVTVPDSSPCPPAKRLKLDPDKNSCDEVSSSSCSQQLCDQSANSDAKMASPAVSSSGIGSSSNGNVASPTTSSTKQSSDCSTDKQSSRVTASTTVKSHDVTTTNDNILSSYTSRNSSHVVSSATIAAAVVGSSLKSSLHGTADSTVINPIGRPTAAGTEQIV